MAYSYNDIYSLLISQGASPGEAATLAAISMAESGGNPSAAKDDNIESSYGLFQINTDVHNVSPQQAMDPASSARYALQLSRDAGYTPWSTYTNGAYARYLGGGTMPDINDIPPDPTYYGGYDDYGSDYGQDYVIDPRTGEPIGFYDEYGEFVRLPALPGSASQSPSSRYINLGNGYLFDAVTGQTVQAYQGAEPTRDVSVRPISGSGQQGYYDQDGNLIQIGQDPGYVSPFEREQWDWSTAYKAGDLTGDYNGQRTLSGQQFDWNQQVDTAGLTGYYDDNPTFAREQWDWSKGLDEAAITGMYQGQPTEFRRQFDVTEARALYEFDQTNAEIIANREQRLYELETELASLEKRADQQAAVQREQISASIANTQAEIAGRIQVASMDNATRLEVAKMEQQTATRGQDITKLLGLRGQDVQLKLGQGELAQRGLESFAEMQGRDPFRASLMAYGEQGGTTPQEGLLSQMQGIYSSMQQPLSYDLSSYKGNGVQPVANRSTESAGGSTVNDWYRKNLPGSEVWLPQGMAQGGVIESDGPVLAVVGENRPEAALLPPGSVIQPINADHGDSLEEMREAAMDAMPAMRRRMGAAGIVPMAEGGLVNPNGSPRTMTWQEEQRQKYPDQKPAFDWGSIFSGIKARLQPETDSPARVAPVQPVTTPDPYAQGQATMGNVLNRIFQPGANIRPGQSWGVQPDPLYGVNVPDPTQMAYSIRTRPINEQKLMNSAWGVRGWSPETVEERINAVSPMAVRPFNVSYGYNGLAVRPMAA